MSITVVRKLLFGGNGGSSFDDFDVIDFNSGGFGNIKSLIINKIEIHCGDVIDFIQFTYNVLTLDGRLIEIIGNGAGGPGGDYRQIYTFAPGEQLVEITGRVGPVGIMFGRSGFQLDGLGSYWTREPMQITVTATETFSTITKTETSSITETETSTAISSISDNSAIAPNSSKIVALSLTTGILGICLLVTIGVFLWRKLRIPRAIPPPLANN